MSMDIVIRCAVPSDLELLVAIKRRASLSNSEDRQALTEHPDAIGVPRGYIHNNRVFVAMNDGAMRGFVTIILREDGDSELAALFVDPDFWGLGIGRALINHCTSVAKAEALRAIHVVGNPHARGFYESCGFITKGTIQMRLGTGLQMQKEIH